MGGASKAGHKDEVAGKALGMVEPGHVGESTVSPIAELLQRRARLREEADRLRGERLRRLRDQTPDGAA